MTRLFFFFISLSANALLAQNLVNNGGFEKHEKITFEIGNYGLNNWKLSLDGGYTPICDTTYVPIKKGSGEYSFCFKGGAKPPEGNTMLRMFGSYLEFRYRMVGSSFSYAVTELADSLVVGGIYEVSYQVFWIDKRMVNDSAWSIIGFKLGYDMPKKNIEVSNFPDAKDPLQFTALAEGTAFVPQIPKDRWAKVTWYVRPLCSMRYLTLGAFVDSSKVDRSKATEFRKLVKETGSTYDLGYYLDNVSVRKVSEIPEGGTLVYASCEPPKEPERKPRNVTEIDPKAKMNCLFDSKSTALTPESLALLDSFAAEAKREPSTTFDICGYTDGLGIDNEQLGLARANMVIDYLVQTHKLPPFRFAARSLADKNPLGDNRTEEGRRLNRRVSALPQAIRSDQLLYRKAVSALALPKPDSVFFYLKVWKMFADAELQPAIHRDPRFQNLKKDKRWAALFQRDLKERYKKYKQPELAQALDSLAACARALNGADTELTELSGESPNTMALPTSEQKTEQTQSLLVDFEKLLAKYQWPQAGKVGRRGSTAAYELLNLSSDAALLAKWIPVVEKNCRRGQANWGHYVRLYDHWQVVQGLPQKFGTQYDASGKRYPVANEAEMLEWRAKLGIFLSEEVKGMKE